MRIEIMPDEAVEAIQKGRVPPRLRVLGSLHLYSHNVPVINLPAEELVVDGWLSIHHGEGLQQLPRRLSCSSLSIYNSPFVRWPEELQVTEEIHLSHCPEVHSLPDHLTIQSLEIYNCSKLKRLPEHLQVEVLKLQSCPALTALPHGLKLRELTLNQCPEITSLPEDLEITDTCFVNGSPQLSAFPPALSARIFTLSGCKTLTKVPLELPAAAHLDLSENPLMEELQALFSGHYQVLKLRNCLNVTALPDTLQVESVLDVSGSIKLTHLPSSIHEIHTLNVSGCVSLTSLPDNLTVHTLNAQGCTGLRSLPENLSVRELNISGCTGLTQWPRGGISELWRLSMRGCTGLPGLPPGYLAFDQLDISDCPQFTQLPASLYINDWIDIANTSLRMLPPLAKGFVLHWHGVIVPGLVALHPEKVTAKMIFAEENVEVRRVMLEQMGIERFLIEANPQTLDSDVDPGGPRRLLRVEMARDEPLISLQVQDPSTGRDYLIRVPPTMTSCHQAAAWIAGFDNPDDYHPIAET